MNGSYDAALNLIYWGTGNPYPDYDGDVRRNRNLYCNSVVALNADTGKLAWTYQFTPHDVWDYDGVNEMVFADGLPAQGRRVNALLHADRNGHLFALDRATGSFSVRQALRPRHLDHRLRCRRPARHQPPRDPQLRRRRGLSRRRRRQGVERHGLLALHAPGVCAGDRKLRHVL